MPGKMTGLGLLSMALALVPEHLRVPLINSVNSGDRADLRESS